MVRMSSLPAVCLLLCLQALAADGRWRGPGTDAGALLRGRPDALSSVALLDRTSDPEGQLLDSLLQPLLRPRYVGTEAHENVRQHMVSVLRGLGWSVDGDRRFQMDTPLGPMSFTNIIATHDPAAPRRLVLACHYDSIHGRDQFVAATDSAVPCAMMLHLAALMTRDYLDPVKGRSEVTLQLMFLDGEEAMVRWSNEDSLYGSRHVAEELARSLHQPASADRSATSEIDRIELFMLLDLLGAAQPTIANYIPDTDRLFRRLVAAEDALRMRGLLEVPQIFHFRDSWRPFGRPSISDDHLPFMQRGVPVLHVIPYPFPSVWHTDADNATAIHGPTVTSLNRILRVFVVDYLHLAGGV